MKTPIKSIMFFANGNTAVFDNNGQQMPELQNSWMEKFLLDLAIKGYYIWNMEIILPDGKKAIIFNTENGINWDIK
jgi:hypothetical protein